MRAVDSDGIVNATSAWSAAGGPPAADHAVVAFSIPSESTARIQEMHVLLLHVILEEVDAWAASA